jgi:hypothetical protein
MSVEPAHARLQFLLSSQSEWNGVDYVEIANTQQTQLRVHFFTSVPVELASAEKVTICGGETINSVAVLALATSPWSADGDGRVILDLEVAAPGDFSTYTLTIDSPTLDPYFDAVPFSFKANCESTLDCAPSTAQCPSPEDEQPPIDYRVKDFAGFKQALSDFSALRYTRWVERSEADVGVMAMEALSALADELSYLQDRVAAESKLETATQRVSLLRLARLVDYEPAPAIAATVTLLLEVGKNTTSVPGGFRCSALGAENQSVPFVVGASPIDPETGQPSLSSGQLSLSSHKVDPRWNAGPVEARNLRPYWWDDSARCLAPGATQLWLIEQGHGLGQEPEQQLLIETAPALDGYPPVREIVRISGVSEVEDPVFKVQLTRIELAAPTELEHDLSRTHFAANLVPAVQGALAQETFAIPAQAPLSAPSPGAAPVVVRAAANWTPEDPRPDYRFSLAALQICWLASAIASADVNASVPAVPLIALEGVDETGVRTAWEWQRSLLDSGAGDAAFTLTPEHYSLAAGTPGVTWLDYDGEGTTIRFGEGTLGLTPTPGTTFAVSYLTGGGTIGNVPADTITQIEPGQDEAEVSAVSNPFAAEGGEEQETAQQIRDRAPQAFRANPLRVVRAEDYVRAAKTLPWVMQAGTSFRWTGSWLTVFTTADPRERAELTIDELEQLSDLLNRRRLAGYESYVLAPSYASIDLQINVCALPSAFAGEVERAVLTCLQPGLLPDGSRGFFDHERWSFGQSLQASALLAAIQRAGGVLGVSSILYRQRGVQWEWAQLPETVAIPADRILRLDDDPSRPEDGSLQVIVGGGK